MVHVLVAAVAVSAGPIERLASSSAPLSLVFREVAGVNPATISAIAIVSTLNTILAQMTMAARVIYGIAREGDLPAIFARAHPRTGTPLICYPVYCSCSRSVGVVRAAYAACGRHLAGDAGAVSRWSISPCCGCAIAACRRTFHTSPSRFGCPTADHSTRALPG